MKNPESGFRWIPSFLVVVVPLWLGMLTECASEETKPPNVVLIFMDDLGYGDVGVYGCTDIPTPHIDRLAKEGVLCTASHITNPPCCPSRCSLIMGQYAQRFGKYGMSRGLPIPEDRPTLPQFLADRGYVTGQVGKWDIGSPLQGPLEIGFGEVAKNPPRKRYTETELADASQQLQKQMSRKNAKSKYYCLDENGDATWLTNYNGDSMVDFIQRHKSGPFFLYWSPEAIHSMNTEVPESLWSRTTAKGKRRLLAGGIVSVDDQVGKLLKVLDENKLRENTLIIFSSDNGANPGEEGSSAPFAGGKGAGTQKEGWVRVPTIFSWQGVIAEGRKYDGLIANFDFYSTIAAASGHAIPKHCDGVDLIPYLNGEKNVDAHEYLFWLNNQPNDAVRRHLIAVRWKEWRLYKKYQQDEWQLFNLKDDPTEENNVAAEFSNIVDQMSKQHDAWVKTLSPLKTVPKIESSAPTIPQGHGWATRKDGN